MTLALILFGVALAVAVVLVWVDYQLHQARLRAWHRDNLC